MDYRVISGTVYIRLDRGDEMIARILEVCAREGIESAVYTGIGGCSCAEVQVFDAETRAFHTREIQGVLELVAFNGNVIPGSDGAPSHHTHALFAFETEGKSRVCGGHLKSATVLYTAELELRPVAGGGIVGRRDGETGTDFWAFEER